MNPRETYAQTGGIDGQELVVQITTGGRSRLALYDLVAHKLRYLSAYINDGAWLWRPDLDGHRILYGAIVPGSAAVAARRILQETGSISAVNQRLAEMFRRSE